MFQTAAANMIKTLPTGIPYLDGRSGEQCLIPPRPDMNVSSSILLRRQFGLEAGEVVVDAAGGAKFVHFPLRLRAVV